MGLGLARIRTRGCVETEIGLGFGLGGRSGHSDYLDGLFFVGMGLSSIPAYVARVSLVVSLGVSMCS